LVDVNVVGYQLPKASAEVSQIASGVKGFKQTDAAQNLEAFGLGQSARLAVIEQHKIRAEFFCQQQILFDKPTLPKIGRLSLPRAHNETSA
jgi:hypothetical protein